MTGRRETGKASGDARMREGKKHEDAHLLGRNTCERQSATSSAESVRRNKSTRPPFHVDTRPEPYYLWAFVSVGNSSETCRADTSLPDVWPASLDPRHRHAGNHVVSRNHRGSITKG